MKAYDWSETHLPTFEDQLAGLSHVEEIDPLAPGALASELSLQSKV
jgi:hypothetical protein